MSEVTKKYLDSAGLQKYTELVKGKIESVATDLEGKISVKADQTVVDAKADQTVVDGLGTRMGKLELAAANVSINTTISPTFLEVGVAGSVTATTSVYGGGEFNAAKHVNSISITDGTTPQAGSKVSSVSKVYEITLAANETRTFTSNAGIEISGATKDLSKQVTLKPYYRTYYIATNAFVGADNKINETALKDCEDLSKVNGNVKSFVDTTAKKTYDYNTNQDRSKLFLFVPSGNAGGNPTFSNKPTFKDGNGYGVQMSEVKDLVTINNVKYRVFYSSGTNIYNSGKNFKITVG